MSGRLGRLIEGRLENLELLGLDGRPRPSPLGAPGPLLVLVALTVLLPVPGDGTLRVVHEVSGGVGHGRSLVQGRPRGESRVTGEAQQTVVVGLTQLGMVQETLLALLLQLLLVIVEGVWTVITFQVNHLN